jgi:predicted enzyme related to lactoylglutathione lyase
VVLSSSDIERSRAFYTELFGWKAEPAKEEFGGYFEFTLDGVMVAGGSPAMEGGDADVWSIYLATDDAVKTVELAAEKGASVVVSPMQVAEQGTMAFVIDPGGAGIGAWQPGVHKGFGIVFETGAASWWELHTRDYAASVQFYRDVFRWETQEMGDTDEFRYTVLQNPDGEGFLGGIMDASAFLPEGVGAHWSVYFGVADADAALARAVELGGSVVAAAEDTPYGKLATAKDPTGAQFKLIAPNEAMPAK